MQLVEMIQYDTISYCMVSNDMDFINKIVSDKNLLKYQGENENAVF